MEDKIKKGIRSIRMKSHKQNNVKKGFTLIELIVVMGVIAILVLLAAPKFLSYTQKAEDTKYIHTAKVIETALDAYLINGGEIGDGLTIVESTMLDEAATNKNLINSKGYIVSVDTNTYYELTDAFIKANLDVKLSASRSIPFIIEAHASNLNKAPNAVYATSDGAVIINKEQTLKGYSDTITPGRDTETPVEEIETPVEVITFESEVAKNPTVLIGTGTVADPYQIWYLEHLAYINKDATTLTANYIMMRDLDFNNDEHYLIITNKTLWTSGLGWLPIGKDFSYSFKGTFNGADKTLTGLFIDRQNQDFVGLFGYINGSEIKNIGLINNKTTGRKYLGGLIGYSTGISTIANSYSRGVIKSASQFVGGLIGSISLEGTVINSYTTGAVTGSDDVGGLIGSLNGTIINSYATGNVLGNNRVGGLVGSSGKTISDSYATGNVTGVHYIGGLIGSLGNVKITNSYAIGAVSGADNIGGFAGWISFGTVANSYRQSNYGNTYGILRTAAQFKSGTKFTGWDSNVWIFVVGQYPKLAWQK